SQRIIDHNFAGEKDHRQLSSEVPGLNNRGQRARQRLAAVQSLEIPFRVIADYSILSRAFLELPARRHRLKGNLESFYPTLEPLADRPQMAVQQPFDLRRQLLAVLPGQRESTIRPAARVRIRVRAAADGDQRNRAGELTLDCLLRVAGPVPADLVELPAQRRAMAGVIG